MKNPFFRKPNVHCLDEVRGLYHLWAPNFSYLVKLRPFLHQFLKDNMLTYEIYFYTAATRLYGELIVQLLKLEMASHCDRHALEVTFDVKRLITRDDKSRFAECQGNHLTATMTEA